MNRSSHRHTVVCSARGRHASTSLARKQASFTRLHFICLVIAARLLAPASAYAQDRSSVYLDHMRRGNEWMTQGKYSEALSAYDEADAISKSPETSYHRALALYRLNRFTEAGKAFQDALKPDRPDLEARIKYNLGRCAHQSALAQRDKLDEAMNEATRAVNFYKEATRLMPEDPDAAQNLVEAQRLAAYLEMKLKEQQEPRKQPSSQPSSQPKDEPASQPDEPQQPSSQPDSSQQRDDSPESDQQDQSEQGEQDESSRKDSQSRQGESSDQKQDRSDESGEQSRQASEDSQNDERDAKEWKQEQIEPMLQEARDQERQRREAKRARMMRMRGRAPVSKDW